MASVAKLLGGWSSSMLFLLDHNLLYVLGAIILVNNVWSMTLSTWWRGEISFRLLNLGVYINKSRWVASNMFNLGICRDWHG